MISKISTQIRCLSNIALSKCFCFATQREIQEVTSSVCKKIESKKHTKKKLVSNRKDRKKEGTRPWSKTLIVISGIFKIFKVFCFC